MCKKTCCVSMVLSHPVLTSCLSVVLHRNSGEGLLSSIPVLEYFGMCSRWSLAVAVDIFLSDNGTAWNRVGLAVFLLERLL